MYFIYGLRLVADLSLYFVFANSIISSWLLALIPGVIYAVYLIAAKKLDTSWDRQADIFALSWKLILAFGLFVCFIGKYQVFIERSLPMAILSLTSSVLLLRMLRHGEDIYLNKQYQFKNLLLLIGVLGITWIMSSKLVLSIILNACSFAYSCFVLPVLTLLISCFTFILGLIIRLFSWMNLTDVEFKESKLPASESPNPFKDISEEMLMQSSSAEIILTIIGILVLLTIVFFLFRRLATSEKNYIPALRGIIVSKEDLPLVKQERNTSLVHQVRRQYRKFLKLCRASGEQILITDTSENIMCKSKKHFSPEMMDEIREIYIRARYNNQASKDDVRKLKHINQTLKQNLD